MSIFSGKLDLHWKYREQKKKNSDSLGHKILELYNVLVQIRLTTGKMKRDIKYSKHGIRAAERVVKQLTPLASPSSTEPPTPTPKYPAQDRRHTRR